MWLKIYYQVVWGRFGMVWRGFVDILEGFGYSITIIWFGLHTLF